MTQDQRPGISSMQLAALLILAGLVGETSPGFSRDFPGGGWSLITAGSAALASGVLRKRSVRLARAVLVAGFLAAGFVLLRGCSGSPAARGRLPAPAAPAAR